MEGKGRLIYGKILSWMQNTPTRNRYRNRYRNQTAWNNEHSRKLIEQIKNESEEQTLGANILN